MRRPHKRFGQGEIRKKLLALTPVFLSMEGHTITHASLNNALLVLCNGIKKFISKREQEEHAETETGGDNSTNITWVVTLNLIAMIFFTHVCGLWPQLIIV